MWFSQLITDYKTYIAAGLLGLFGSLANVLYQHAANIKKMSMVYTIISLIIGFFVGNLIGSFIPITFLYRDGVLMMAGFGCYPILSVVEDKVLYIMSKIPNVSKFLSKD